MSMQTKDLRFAFMGNHYTSQNGWNRKMCFEARDTLFECVDRDGNNNNKYMCPDELYAYEMWCPNDFRRMHSQWKRRADIESEMYDKEMVDKINSERAFVGGAKFAPK